MTLVANLTFHMSKLKPDHEDKKKKDYKQTYHLGFDLAEHKFIVDMECILATR
jgi:hypothetical protein